MVASVAYQNKGSSSSSSASYTYTGVTLAEPAHAYRKLLVAVASYRASGTQVAPSGVTADGAAMTLVGSGTADTTAHEVDCSFWIIDFPTGADVDIVVTYPSVNPLGSGMAIWALNGAIAWPKRAQDIDGANGDVTNNVAVLIGDYVFTTASTRITSNSRRFGAGESAQIVADNASYAVGVTSSVVMTGVTQRVNDSIGGASLGARAVALSVSLTPKVPTITPPVGLTAGGTAVTIKGYGFTGATAVTFDGNAATSLVVVDDETITCVTPAGTSGLVDVVIDRPTTDITLVDAFTYSDVPSPEFISITPDFGNIAGGTAVTIVGDYFTGVTDVKFGGPLGASATSLVIVDDETMTMVTPAQPDGPSDIWIVNPDTGNTLVEEGFDFRPFNRISQSPILFINLPSRPARLTQTPLLIVNEPAQGVMVTQAPVLDVYLPTPIPLPAPIWPEVPVTEVWQYRTIINAAERGKEQRSALRAAPRINMRFSALIMNGAERRDVYQLLMKYIHRVFNYPLYSHATLVSAVSIAGTTKLYFDPAATDMRAGEAIALIDAQTMQTVHVAIASVDVDGATTAEPLPVTVWGHWYVAPAPEFRPTPTMLLEMNAIDGEFSLSLLGTQARAVKRPDQSNGLLTIIDGMLLLDKRPLADDAVDEEFDQNVTWLDNNVAPPVPRTNWPVAYASGERQFLVHRPSGMDYWRAVADNLRGRQKAFLLPTFRDDLPLYEVPALGATEIKTSNVQFFDFWRSKAWRYIRIQSSAGVIYRKINEVIDHYDPSGQPLYLTIKLAASIGAGAGANANMMVSYVNTCRLDSDEIVMRHGPVDTVLTLKVRTVEE